MWYATLPDGTPKGNDKQTLERLLDSLDEKKAGIVADVVAVAVLVIIVLGATAAAVWLW